MARVEIGMGTAHVTESSAATIARLHPIVEACPLAIVLTDSHGRIVLVNPATELLFGYAQQELISQPVEKLIPQRFHARHVEQRQSFVAEPRTIPGPGRQVYGVRKDGTEFPAEIVLHPIPTTDGVVIFGSVVDTSQRVEAEIALKDTEARYRSLVESLPLNVFQKDLDGHFVFVNQRMCEAMGHSRDEILGKTDFDFFPQESALKYRSDDVKVTTSGDIVEDIEEHLGSTSGEKTYVHVLKAPVRDAQGQIVGIQGMFWDVSARRQAEQALRRSEERARLIVDTAYDAYIAADADGIIIEWNAQSEQTFGWTRREAVGKKLSDIIIPSRFQADHEQGMQRYRETGKSRILNQRIEIEALHRDGREFPIELTVWPLEVEGTTCFNAFVHDITERKIPRKLSGKAPHGSIVSSTRTSSVSCLQTSAAELPKRTMLFSTLSVTTAKIFPPARSGGIR